MEEQNSESLHSEQEEMNASNSSHSSMKFLPVILAVIITAVVVGGGVYWWQSSQAPQPTTESETSTADETSAEPATVESAAASNQVVEYNCEQSGGSYSNGACSCSDGEYEKSTGYCITAIGSPGGELQKEAAKLQELVMLKNTIVTYNCKQSGGTFKNDACSCPTEQGEKLEYDSDTGYCMSAFGIPGGEQGETAKKLQELEMLKNQ